MVTMRDFKRNEALIGKKRDVMKDLWIWHHAIGQLSNRHEPKLGTKKLC